MRPMYFLVLSLSVGTLWLSSCNSVIREPEKSEPATHEIVLPYAPPTLKVIEPPPLPPVPAEVVFHGPRDTKKIALTFDACSTRQPSRCAVLAMSSGLARSASTSYSRALLMSQFWQNLQPRLQPLVPKDRTGVPGRKW